MHRLWYDLRSQSLFEDAFRADVAAIDKSLEKMIWRVMSRLSELADKPLQVQPAVIYAMLDGLFQQCLLKHLSGDEKAVGAMQEQVRWTVSQIIGVPLREEGRVAKPARKRQPARVPA